MNRPPYAGLSDSTLVALKGACGTAEPIDWLATKVIILALIDEIETWRRYGDTKERDRLERALTDSRIPIEARV
jgi:hypothetical protein